jgi:glycosyltransferase involved in cell wall biosynthesis
LSVNADSDWLIDISRLLWRSWQGRLSTGIDRVTLAYVRRFSARSQALIQIRGRAWVLPKTVSQRVFSILSEASKDLGFTRQSTRRALLRTIAPALLSPTLPHPAGKGTLSGRIALYTGHTGLENPRLVQWISRSGQRPVYFLHDLIPCTHPEYCRPGVAAIHAQRARHMLTTGHAILVNSAETRNALTRFAQTEQLRQPPIEVAWLASGISIHPEAPNAPTFDQPYFIMLGTIEPRKNHLRMLEIWRDWEQYENSPRPHLLIIGQRGWECENVLDMLDRCAAIHPWVHEIGRCSDVELVHHLHHAQALLMPSFVEGFGMPLIEALTHELPVIASDLGVFREVAGEIPDYLDPSDGIGWRRAIAEYAMPQSPRRAEQLKRLEHFQAPTWDNHFSTVERFLADL